MGSQLASPTWAHDQGCRSHATPPSHQSTRYATQGTIGAFCSEIFESYTVCHAFHISFWGFLLTPAAASVSGRGRRSLHGLYSDNSSDESASEEDDEDESEMDAEEVEAQYTKLQADRLAEGRKKVCRASAPNLQWTDRVI